MSASARPISEYLEVAQRFRRSVNIEKDYRGSLQNGEYIVTPTALEALHRLTEGLEEGSPSRAWTITGPYGVGKSAFAVFLTRLFCSTEQNGVAARERLRRTDPELSLELQSREVCQNGTKGFLPVLVTARRAAAPNCIAEGLVAALKSGKTAKLTTVARSLGRKVRTAANGSQLDTRWITSALDTSAKAAKEAGFQGLLIIVDELGKLFEYAARFPQKGDVYVLQELAEHVSRSHDFPSIFVGLLHQSFEEYGHHLDIGTRREWSKIQGRFGDVAFLEPAEQVIRLVAEAITCKGPTWPRGLKKRVEHVVAVASSAGIAPPGMSAQEFKKIALAAYPLHPVTLVALPYIFRRFAQNERSLFSYLSSMEPYGFQEFAKTHAMTAKSPEFVRLVDLFDYFTSNFGLGLYRQPQALRWMEAADVLDRKDDLGKVHRDVVKTVGVLSALGQFSHLSASALTIALSVQDRASPNASLQSVLESLRSASVLTYRSYNKSYRIWEGSDVDIEERIAEGERKTQQSLGLAESVRDYVPSRPMVARRHSFETGALRSFDVRYVDTIESLDEVINADTAMDGKVIVCLAESPSLAEQFRGRAEEANDAVDVLFAIPQEIGELRGVVTELGALRWVWENTPELRDDRVARRDISLRITEAEQLLQRNLNGLVDPRPEPDGSDCLWYHTGERQRVKTPTAVSQLLSDVCDQLFAKSPKIRNELVVRRSLSSAAAAARRNLIEGMLQRGDKPLLGIEGYPPERSIYESVLGATRIHREEQNGSCAFAPPSRSPKHRLLPCWNQFTDIVFKRQPEPIPLTDLFGLLSDPPFGLLDGLHPIFLCAFMVVYPDETTLYREGTFLPEPGIADFEVLMRRPELFAIAGSRVKGGRAAVVDRLAKGLKVKAATVPVVRSLFRMVKSLPDFAWNTRRLSTQTLALRDAFHNARSPERFLFVEVPEALGLSPFSERKPKENDLDRFFNDLNCRLQEWAAVMPLALEEARDSLLDACGYPPGDAGWDSLRQQAVRLESGVTEPQLLAFLRRVVQSDAGRSGVESVCALVASRPPANWSDADVQRFPEAALAIGRSFQKAAVARAGKAGPSEILGGLNATERKRADKLVRSLRTHLGKITKQESSRVIRAALTQLSLEIDDSVFE